MKKSREFLVKTAEEARASSYSPYSGFSVGAALLCADGSIYTGCNIENTAYAPTCCAERVAIFKAVSESKRDFDAIAVVGGGTEKIEEFCYPCGVCRQVLSEFCDSSLEVVLFNGKDISVCTLGELLPKSFRMDSDKTL